MLDAGAQQELMRYKSAVEGRAAATAADLERQREAVAAARAAAADKARAVDAEARELAQQRAELEQQLAAFQVQVTLGFGCVAVYAGRVAACSTATAATQHDIHP